jgi:hypothetical protein
MVVKNTDKAKEYLDLTELEYSSLKDLAARFTPAALAYHVSLLEDALLDMQRAFNSKRAIAEIALTRMCDARTVSTLPALALRIEQLERELSLVKLGGATLSSNDAEAVTVLPVTKHESTPTEKTSDTQKTVTEEKPKAKTPESLPYAGWRSVLERIGEIKPSLAVKFQGSAALRRGESTFLVRLNAFFASLLTKSEADLAVLRGVIAECAGITKENIRLEIEPIDGTHPSDFSDEIRCAIESDL